MNWARVSHCVVALLCRLFSCCHQTSNETNHHQLLTHHPHPHRQWHRCKNCTEQNVELGRRCLRWSHVWKCVWFWGFLDKCIHGSRTFQVVVECNGPILYSVVSAKGGTIPVSTFWTWSSIPNPGNTPCEASDVVGPAEYWAE